MTDNGKARAGAMDIDAGQALTRVPEWRCAKFAQTSLDALVGAYDTPFIPFP